MTSEIERGVFWKTVARPTAFRKGVVGQNVQQVFCGDGTNQQRIGVGNGADDGVAVLHTGADGDIKIEIRQREFSGFNGVELRNFSGSEHAVEQADFIQRAEIEIGIIPLNAEIELVGHAQSSHRRAEGGIKLAVNVKTDEGVAVIKGDADGVPVTIIDAAIAGVVGLIHLNFHAAMIDANLKTVAGTGRIHFANQTVKAAEIIRGLNPASSGQIGDRFKLRRAVVGNLLGAVEIVSGIRLAKTIGGGRGGIHERIVQETTGVIRVAIERIKRDEPAIEKSLGVKWGGQREGDGKNSKDSFNSFHRQFLILFFFVINRTISNNGGHTRASGLNAQINLFS